MPLEYCKRTAENPCPVHTGLRAEEKETVHIVNIPSIMISFNPGGSGRWYIESTCTNSVTAVTFQTQVLAKQRIKAHISSAIPWTGLDHRQRKGLYKIACMWGQLKY